MTRTKTLVMSDASGDDATECTFLHCWTPRGLTRKGPGPIIETAKRCGWKATISVQAATHREAVEKACAIFTKQRAQRPRRKS